MQSTSKRMERKRVKERQGLCFKKEGLKKAEEGQMRGEKKRTGIRGGKERHRNLLC